MGSRNVGQIQTPGHLYRRAFRLSFRGCSLQQIRQLNPPLGAIGSVFARAWPQPIRRLGLDLKPWAVTLFDRASGRSASIWIRRSRAHA